MLNLVQIMGFLGKDPELRYTQAGKACANLSIATTETWADQNGQKQSHTEWHKAVVWGKPAENCAKYLVKGKGVYVSGKLQTRSWTDNSGATRYTTEINAKEVVFLPSGNNNQQGDRGAPAQGQAQQPYNQQARAQNQGSYGSDPSMPPNLDDIPF